jgi:hemolysin activation/secretion protein
MSKRKSGILSAALRLSSGKISRATALALFGLLFVMVSAIVPAGAQVAVPPPAAVGREVQNVNPQAPQGKLEAPLPSLPGTVQLDATTASRHVHFNEVVIEGATAFSASELAPLFAHVLRRDATMAEVAQAVNQVSKRYADAGYVFCSVILPKQNLDGDRLRIVVVEGYVSDVEVQGDIASEGVRERIRAVVSALVGRKPLLRGDLERRLLIASDTPGLTLSAGARPSGNGQLGAVTVVLNGSFKRFDPLAQIDSFQTSPSTVVNLRTGVIGNSLLFGGDSLEARYITALPWNTLHLADLRYGLPIGTDGAHFDLLGQAVWQRPFTTINGQPADFLGRSWLARAQFSYPFLRRSDLTVLAFGLVDVIEANFLLTGIYIPGDSLRVARGGISTAFNDGWNGIWRIVGQISKGLDVANAQSLGRVDATPSFSKFQLSAQRAQPIGTHFAAVISASAQLTPDTLPASEVFAFGGREYGRAFNVAEIVSDQAIAASAELRYGLDWLPIAKTIVDSQLYAFVDYAHLASVLAANAPAQTDVGSTGFGLRARIMDKVSGEVELATPIMGQSIYSASGQPWRVSFRLGTRF